MRLILFIIINSLLFQHCNDYEQVKPPIQLVKLKKEESYIINKCKETLTLYLLPTPADATDFHAQTLEIKPGTSYILKDISHIQIASLYKKKSNYEIIKIDTQKHYELYLNPKRQCYDLKLIQP